MITVNFQKDIPNKTIEMNTIFDAPRQAVWDAWTNSDQLDQWWGPEGWPAKTASHDFREGGHWHYKMTSEADGTESWSWVDYLDVNPIDGFSGQDYFADKDGNKNPDMPSTHWVLNFEEEAGKTHVRCTLSCATEEEVQKLIDMGFEGGFTMGLHNLDDFLATQKVEA